MICPSPIAACKFASIEPTVQQVPTADTYDTLTLVRPWTRRHTRITLPDISSPFSFLILSLFDSGCVISRFSRFIESVGMIT